MNTNNKIDRAKIFSQMGFLLVLGLGVVGLFYFLLSSKTESSNRSVRLQVVASGGYSIVTLQAGGVKIKKSDTVTSPWNSTIKIDSGDAVYLAASNPTQTGKITCSIVVNNQVIDSDTTLAPKDGVACAGIIP
jgi:hypothetical protein